MFSVRWRKFARDLWTNESRTLLAILAIAVGIFGVGSIMSAYTILTREVNVSFASTNPASAILYVAGADNELAMAVESLPEVAGAEARRVVRARIQVEPDEWSPIMLFVIDDFNALRVSTITSEQGDWPPADHEILIERSSVSVIDNQPGEVMAIQTPNGQMRALRSSGIVFDPARAPGWQDDLNYGYITLNTLDWLGETRALNELRIVVAENTTDAPHITKVAYEVKDFVETRGYNVSVVSVPTPGKHPTTDVMGSLLFLLEAFGVLALVLSGVLVATIISALLAQQIRQIGVMKAIGARTYQIAGLYFSTVLVYGIAALAIGIPLSVSAGRTYAEFTAKLLNFNITSDFIPYWVFAVQILLGLSVPLLSAAVPIFKGSRITVREAISDYGIGATRFGTSVIDNLVANVRGLNRPLMLSLRNTFRRRARLFLIVTVLATGGAVFISAFNVSQSWSNTIDVVFQALRYDIRVVFAEPYPVTRVEETIGAVPGVVNVESWGEFRVVQERPDGTDGIRFNLTAVPPATDLIAFPIIEGRWLQPGDTNAIVINHELFYDQEADVSTGDPISLRIGDQTIEWEVVGVVRDVTSVSAYVNLEYIARITGTEGMATTVRVQTSEHSDEALRTMSQKLERQMDAAGIRRISVRASTEGRQMLEDHLVVILVFLLIMAVLVASVGGLALASVISINVMERSREIGIMRAIGASTHAVLQVVIVEGVVIGILSWLVAILVAWPLSVIIGNFVGWLFFRSGLENAFPPFAMVGWLGLIVLISIVASFFPAWSAARLTVREVVAYE